MTLPRLAAPALLVMLLVSACGHQGGVGAVTRTRPATPSSAATPSTPLPASHAATPAAPASMAVRPVASVTLNATDAGPLAVGDYRHGIVLAPISRTPETHWDTLELIDDRSSTVKDVAHSAWPHGLINWVATTGDWIAWTDQSAEQGDAAMNVLWRIHAQNLRTGERRVLASNGAVPDAFIPVIKAQDGLFFWTEPEADRSARELVWRPGAAAPRAILRNAEMTPGSGSIDHGMFIYLGGNGRGIKGHTTGGDCWQVPVEGGTPIALTHTALAMACAARGDHLTWTQHIDPNTPTPPPDGIFDDPYSLWVLKLSGSSEPELVHDGYSETYQLGLTDHALVWLPQSEKAMVVDLADPSRQLRLAPTSARSYSVGPDDLCAFETIKKGRVTVTVVRLA